MMATDPVVAAENERLRELLRAWYWADQDRPGTVAREALRDRTHRALARLGPEWAGHDDD